MDLTHEKIEDAIETGIDTIIEKVKTHVNLPPDVEDILDKALHIAATHGMEIAQKIVQAMRLRVGDDAA